ncbi:MAG: efflux RND transporter periplasmic adaptor subunit [Acidobacteriaceae bacterium]|nr:efflux RND transporter periplasmic adaptor subunit [Acidobacteriaceae bacterium]
MSRFRIILGLVIVLVIVAAVVASGIIPRVRVQKALRAETERAAEPVVTVFRPTRGNPAEEVVLPGNIQAFVDAPIFARTNGYLKRWTHDIGSHVKKSELLAEIDSPEVDQQLEQAKHDLATAQANLALAQITSKRYVDLFKTDSVAKQDVDNAVQSAAAQQATVKSAQANVDRLQQLVDFEKVYAPFDGVITARNTDIGQLINSGSAGGQARELFHIAAIDRLRVFVQVPQVYSHDTVPGMQADLALPELPGRRFPGKLVRTADAFDPNTRTLLVEVDVVNSTGLLFPGAYTEVHFKIRPRGTTLIIPSTSLIFRARGLRVPVIVNGNKVDLLPVTVGRDFGNTIEIVAGLPDNASVIANPPDSLVEGEIVRIVAAKETKEIED